MLGEAWSALGRTPTAPPPIVMPHDVDARIRRGAKHMRETAAKVRLCQLFLSGETYSFINASGALNFQEINPGQRSGKPAHRIRNRYNFVRPLVDTKVSSSTTKVPSYEVNPTGTDPQTVAAAQLAEKILRMGYFTWYLREARVQAATLAIGGGGVSYAMPYFDGMVGPFVELQDPATGEITNQGEGEIKVAVYGRNEVLSEPGVEFHHSRWYAIRTARPISEVEGMEDFIPGPLVGDANTTDQPTEVPTKDMVLVTMYFERPCPDWPDGRFLTYANGRQILPEAQYPMRRGDKAVDRPCLHELMYRMDVDGGADLGLTWELIDFQRTANDCYNKIIELKNRALNLQILAPVGSLTKPRTDEPGGITYYNPIGGQKPEWEKAPDSNIMAQLMNVLDRVLTDMRSCAADAEVHVASNVSAGAIQFVQQQAANRWLQYIDGLARWDSEVAAHCLMLAQEHYTEERVLKIKGRYGWEPDGAFRGADILGQIDVRVNPSSVETQSRSAIQQQLGWIQANFPGFLRPEVAIELVLTGTNTEAVIESFEFDKARANMVIQKIRDGSVMSMPPQSIPVPGPPDPLTGAPSEQEAAVPGWMPRPFDNVDIQLWVIETWMKSDDYNRLPPEMQAVAMLVYQGMKSLQDQQAARAAAAQTAQAQALGQTNAAKPQPQDGKPMPSTPNPGTDPGVK